MFLRLFNILVITVLMAGSAAVSAYADCAGPAGKAADIIYNADYKVMQYCNGIVWVGMGSGDTYFWKETGADSISYSGAVIVGNSSASCDDSLKGALRYDPAAKRFEGCTNGQWQGLVQQIPQLGTPLYAKTFDEADYTAYNNTLMNYVTQRANAMYGAGSQAANDFIAAIHGLCLMTNGIPSSTSTSGSACGIHYCYAKTGREPFQSQVSVVCEQGGSPSCNGGNFYIRWACLMTAE